MIEALKHDEVIQKLGGRFKLTALIQKRWLELMQGARPMVEGNFRTPMQLIVQEILEGKIAIDYEQSDIDPEAGRE